MATIYVALLNEGTEVWRPVEAFQIDSDTYRLIGSAPEEEDWEYAPGSIVRCELKVFADGEARLTAIGNG